MVVALLDVLSDPNAFFLNIIEDIFIISKASTVNL